MQWPKKDVCFLFYLFYNQARFGNGKKCLFKTFYEASKRKGPTQDSKNMLRLHMSERDLP